MSTGTSKTPTPDSNRLSREDLEVIALRVRTCRYVPDDVRRLLRHARAVESELVFQERAADCYRAQLECMEASLWFRLGRRFIGFRPLRSLGTFKAN